MLLSPAESASLRPWLLPDRPGPLVGLHALATGCGAAFADRFPGPSALFWTSAGNGALLGDPSPDFLRQHQPLITGQFVDAPPGWEPALREIFPRLQIWQRIVASLDRQPPAPPAGLVVRRMTRLDAPALWAISRENAWIANTWGGPDGLAASGMAWGAFDGSRLAAAACSFTVGERFEEIGVVTEAADRGRGLSHACAAGLCGDIFARGRRPSWTTSPDNAASLRVAQKLGFRFERDDRLYALGLAIPPAATAGG